MPKRHGGYAAFLNMCCSQTCDQAVNKPGVCLAIGHVSATCSMAFLGQ
jgi:hypothetical protein